MWSRLFTGARRPTSGGSSPFMCLNPISPCVVLGWVGCTVLGGILPMVNWPCLARGWSRGSPRDHRSLVGTQYKYLDLNKIALSNIKLSSYLTLWPLEASQDVDHPWFLAESYCSCRDVDSPERIWPTNPGAILVYTSGVILGFVGRPNINLGRDKACHLK